MGGIGGGSGMAHAQVQEVSRAAALLQLLQARPIAGQDPRELVEHGVPFDLQTEGGRLLLVLQIHSEGELLWVNAAAGKGRADMTRTGLEFIEQCARQAGCREVGFTTARRGLVRKACRLGYRLSGGEMRKALQ